MSESEQDEAQVAVGVRTGPGMPARSCVLEQGKIVALGGIIVILKTMDTQRDAAGVQQQVGWTLGDLAY